jgi:hypothetical protein
MQTTSSPIIQVACSTYQALTCEHNGNQSHNCIWCYWLEDKDNYIQMASAGLPLLGLMWHHKPRWDVVRSTWKLAP